MPGDGNDKAGMTGRVPLYLIPKAIADLIRKNGEGIFRIVATRQGYHYYQITIEKIGEQPKPVPDEKTEIKNGDGNG
jgi:hypothetical protein